MGNYFKGNGPYPVLPANILKLYLNVGYLLDSNYAKIIFEKQEQSVSAYAVKNRGRWPSGKETIKMPIMLTRKDGPPTPFRNAEYIPFYYFIPKSILSHCGAELNAIPRNPQELFHNRAACEFVESDLFRLLIIDATAFMVWPYMGFGEYMEIYSGYDPAWRFAHCPDYWIQELTDEGILASAGELFKGCHSELGYVPERQIDIYLRYIVPNVMKKHRMNEIIQVAREYPCFEDFDFRKSNQKTDFIRKWYHTRTRHPMISLEEFQEAYSQFLSPLYRAKVYHGEPPRFSEFMEPLAEKLREDPGIAQKLYELEHYFTFH